MQICVNELDNTKQCHIQLTGQLKSYRTDSGAPVAICGSWLASAPLSPTHHLLVEPFENGLVTEDILPQTLHHADSLPSKILNSSLNQVNVPIENPIFIVRSRCIPSLHVVYAVNLHGGNANSLFFPLSSEHVNH